MSGTGSNKAAKLGVLSPQQERAVAALLTEPTIALAAKAAGVSERTLYRWLDLPAFRDAYAAARRAAVQQAVARLQQTSSAAVSFMLRLMASVDSPPAVRLAAAKTVLDLSFRAVELEQLEQRIAALEQAHVERILPSAP